MTRTPSTAKRSAPASAYVLTALTGGGVALAFGAVAAWLRDDGGYLLNFVVFALVGAGPAISLAWMTFVAKYTVPDDKHREDNAESRWITEATSGAFYDVVMAASLVLVIGSIARIEVAGTTVLLAVVILALADTAVRYSLVQRRAA